MDCENSVSTVDVFMDRLEHIEKDIFEYNTESINSDVVSVFSYVIENNLISSVDAQRLMSLNVIMGECLTAMQSCDYLLLADLLKYRLTPILEVSN